MRGRFIGPFLAPPGQGNSPLICTSTSAFGSLALVRFLLLHTTSMTPMHASQHAQWLASGLQVLADLCPLLKSTCSGEVQCHMS